MRKFFAVVMVLWFSVFSAVSQEGGGVSDGDEADSNYVVRANQKGDQFLHFALLVAVPLSPPPNKLLVGGEGILGYLRFLSPSVALGGTLSFGYHATVGDNIFYYVPISAKILYQPTFRRLEFPLSLSVGGAFENYINRTYFGLFVKPEAGAYYRFSAAWSFGLIGGVQIMPQWYKDADKNFVGIITDIGLAGRYHF